jgi:hypothetical protein
MLSVAFRSAKAANNSRSFCRAKDDIPPISRVSEQQLIRLKARY